MKFRNPIIILALTMALIVVAACSSGPSEKEAYDIFTVTMDKVAGPGNWTAKDHTMKGGVLSVNGVTVTLPAMAATQPVVAEEAPVAAQPAEGSETKDAAQPTEGDAAKDAAQPAEAEKAPAAPANTLEIATVELKTALTKADFDKIMALTSWRDQKETKLAESLILKGVSLPGMSMGVGTTNMVIEEIALNQVALAAAAADAPEGRVGFLKALRMASLSYKNFKVNSVVEMPGQPRMESASQVALATVEGVAFDGQPLEGLGPLDPTGFLTAMTAMTAKSATIKDMSVTFGDDKAKGTFVIASLVEKDIQPLGAIGSLIMDGLKFDIAPVADNPSVSMVLANLTINGLDMSDYIRKVVPYVLASITDPNAASDAMMKTYNLADFVASPMSLKDMSIKGFDLNVGGAFGVKMAEASVVGPYVTGQIPANQKTLVKGLEINLPGPDFADNKNFKDMVEFAKFFGMSRFEIEFESASSHDPASGLWKNDTFRLTAKDLAELNGTAEIGGLTGDRLTKMRETSLDSMFMVLMAPGEVLGDLSFNGLTLKLDDKGLVNRIFKYAAAMEAQNPEVAPEAVEAMRKQAVAGVDLMVTLGAAQYLENPGELGKSLAAFLKEPGKLEIKVAPAPPLSYKSVVSMNADINKVLNSMNISVSANDTAAPALRFVIPTASHQDRGLEPPMENDGEDE